MRNIFILFTIWVLVISCENKPLTEGEEFRPREIHTDLKMHFDRIEVDGIEYLILEKDNNNPHEGFGFMAFRANVLMEKQDSIIAYLLTVNQMQALIYAKLYNTSLENAENLVSEYFNKNLEAETEELKRLENATMSNERDTASNSEN